MGYDESVGNLVKLLNYEKNDKLIANGQPTVVYFAFRSILMLGKCSLLRVPEQPDEVNTHGLHDVWC